MICYKMLLKPMICSDKFCKNHLAGILSKKKYSKVNTNNNRIL